jgi:general stress protein 26
VLVYTILDDFSVLVSTHKTSRKWINLQSNSHVALIFGGSFSGLNIQYEGTAELIESEEMYFTAHPETKMYKSEDTAFIKITPTWLRINDYTKHPPEVTELSF